MTSLSDSLVKQACASLARKVEAEYNRVFPYVSASQEFFFTLSRVDIKLTAMWSKRPITRAEINALEMRAFKSLRASMLKDAKENPQPNYQKATNIETGEVRLV